MDAFGLVQFEGQGFDGTDGGHHLLEHFVLVDLLGRKGVAQNED
jgi:hypothetical protein